MGKSSPAPCFFIQAAPGSSPPLSQRIPPTNDPTPSTHHGTYPLTLNSNGASCIELAIADFYNSVDWFGEGYITRVVNCGGKHITRVMDRLPTLRGERVPYGSGAY